MKTAGASQVGAAEAQGMILYLEEGAMLEECLLALCERRSYLLGVWEFSDICLIQPPQMVIRLSGGMELLVIFYREGMCSLLERKDELKSFDQVVLALDRPLDEMDDEQNEELKKWRAKMPNLLIFGRSESFYSTFFHYCLDSPSPSSVFSSLVRRLEKAGKKEDFYFA